VESQTALSHHINQSIIDIIHYRQSLQSLSIVAQPVNTASHLQTTTKQVSVRKERKKAQLLLTTCAMYKLCSLTGDTRSNNQNIVYSQD